MKHIHDIPPYNLTNEDRLRQIIESQVTTTGNTVAYEMVFTDHKLKNGWREALDRLGFKHTFRWKNPNSPNYCNQFVYGQERPFENGQQEN